MGHQQELEGFNANRTKDILFKRILETKSDEATVLLANILATNRSEFHIKTIGGNSLEHLARYDSSLYQEIKSDTISGMRSLRGKVPLNTLHNTLAAILFGQTNALPFEEVHLDFGIFTDLGNLNIVIRHKLIPDPENLEQSGSSQEFIKSAGDRFKMDPDGEVAITVTKK